MAAPPDLTLARARIRLRLTHDVHFRGHQHGGVLSGLLRAALGPHELPPGLLPFACESGWRDFRAGEEYGFVVTLAGPHAPDLGILVGGLAREGARRVPPREAPATLGGNFEVIAADPLPSPDLARDLASVTGLREMTLTFVSPLEGGGFVGDHGFDAAFLLSRLFQRPFDVLVRARPRGGAQRDLWPCEPSARVVRADLVRVPMHVKGRPRTDVDRRFRPDGVARHGWQGQVVLAAMPAEWLPWIVLGQYLHVGHGVHFGLGRFVIHELGAAACTPLAPTRTLLDRVSDVDRLERARMHLQAHQRATRTHRGSELDASEAELEALVEARRTADHPPVGSDEPDMEDLVMRLGAELRDKRYVPGTLQGFTIPKADGRLRPLAVPRWRDRIVQRAACDVLTPLVEEVLEDCSYAYRRGRSRFSAAREIEGAVADGYCWVLDADIRSFFDTAAWPQVMAVVRALLPRDPLVPLVEAWLHAPVTFGDRVIERRRGLPQGMPLSPLLANLLLDQFDEVIAAQGFRLVRFADDFIILCRDLGAAERARDAARHALAALGLALHEGKTEVRSVDSGFTYLGLLFCRSLVLPAAASVPESTPEDQVPSESWLAQVPLADVRRVHAAHRGRAVTRERAPVPVALVVGGPETPREPVFVSGSGASLSLQHGTLAIEETGVPPRRLALRHVSHLTLCGRTRVTVPLLTALAEQQIPSFVCAGDGRLQWMTLPPAASWSAWSAQARLAENPMGCLAIGRVLVRAKLRHQQATLTHAGVERAHAAVPELRVLVDRCAGAATMPELLGIEGRGAAVYFGALGALFGPEWHFDARVARPAPDPVNALLSLGYAILHHHAATALIGAGLHPGIGFLHRGRGRHLALASDLVEEFRHLVDRLVLSLVHRREVSPDDFAVRLGSAGARCEIGDASRRKFARALLQRLAQQVTRGEASRAYREWMDVQAHRLQAVATGRARGYDPFEER